MRVELDEPLSKTRLRQILKMCKDTGTVIKVVCGTEVLDIDVVSTANNTIYLHTDSEQTVNLRLQDIYETQNK